MTKSKRSRRSERHLLEAVESVGGEVDTQELLDLEREPLRLRGAGGVTATRRGAGFSLERRAFLIPIHPNRHVIPSEVAQVVGAERRRLRETCRAEIRSFCCRGRPCAASRSVCFQSRILALAMGFCVREPGNEVRSGVGTPRSLLVKLAQRYGRDVEAIALLAALSRAVGLWTRRPPLLQRRRAHWRCTTDPVALCDMAARWCVGRSPRRRGGSAPCGSQPDASPIGALREMVIEALQDLGEGDGCRGTPSRAISVPTSGSLASSGCCDAGLIARA